ncbi:MAG: hypothetical protein RLZZ387_335 [Chloroflexota bacterium]
MHRLLSIALLTLLLVAIPAPPAAAVVPAEFSDSLVANVGQPTSLAFTPDGRLLITTQPGALRVYRAGVLLPQPALSLGARVCANSERGLLGMALDPGFAENGHLYLFYTFNKHGVCPESSPSSPSNPVNRVSRFTISGDTVDPTSELVLVDNMPSPNGNHNAGDLFVGKDGYLYISIGDGGCDYALDSGCAGSNDAARDTHVLIGKILRITRDGAIPPGNPHQNPATTARCNVNGRTDAGKTCREIFATGLRNPFRIAADPDAVGTRFFINDVGQGAWEEIDEGVAGADYGWPWREGPCANSVRCSPPFQTPVGLTNPVYAYNHQASTPSCSSITGGAFVPHDSGWPDAYLGAYLYGDYGCGKIVRLTPGSSGGFGLTPADFATGLGGSSAVHLTFGPSARGTSLYYTTYTAGGQVRRIDSLQSQNRPPTASATATPRFTAGLSLTVSFDARASRDVDGDPLTFAWAFGDGATGSGSTTSHTYTSPGTYSAALTVSDGRGGVSSPLTLRIDVGNTPPTAVITEPSTSATFAVGEAITLRASANDAQDVQPPSLSWEVLLRHNDHTHPYVSGTGPELTLTGPAPEDLPAAWSSSLEVRLTATDSTGLQTTVTREIQPRTVELTLASEPPGLQLEVSGTLVTTPAVVTSWEGWGLRVAAHTQPGPDGLWYALERWEQGGEATQTIVTPDAPANYTAVFEPTHVSLLPVVSR